MLPGSSDLRRVLTVDKSNDQAAQGGQDLWRIASAQTGAILSKADIPHIVQAILNTPMSSHQFQQTLGTGLGGRESGDEIDDLGRGLACFGDSASELGHLSDRGSGGSEKRIHLGTDLDGAHFGVSTSTVSSHGLQITCKRIGKVGRQVGGEGGLIAFDGQDGLGLLRMHDAHEVGLSVQGIGSTDLVPDW